MGDFLHNATDQSKEDLTKLLDGPEEDLVLWKSLAKVIRYLLKQKLVQGKGIQLDHTAQGIIINALSDTGGSFPFQPSATDGGVLIRHGNFGDFAVPDTVVSPPSSGDGSIYFALTYELHLNDAETRVLGGVITDVSIEAGSTKPDDTDTVFYVQICPTLDGTALDADIRYSLAYSICDDGSGAGVGLLKLGIAG